MQRSVFDVAARLFRVSGRGEISAIKLEKLMYYIYGWYGRLTGEPLFRQQFYAMTYGPVVGDLLSLHSEQEVVSLELIEQVCATFEDAPLEDDFYLDQVVEAVWEYYGEIDQWDLVEMTHQEDPWIKAWEGREEGTRRSYLDSEDIIDFFLWRKMPPELFYLLPPPQIMPITAKGAEILETLGAEQGEKAREIFAQCGLVEA
ncbi:Panacea domain-containing protein [Varibaculum prostatecancerukia]|uniref:Panacea domain-containing protein n=1 Tax=Varibaculum prostatecancerukia TaxID=2811781 RepID=UPI001C007803|nr:type II toxin-antitoxin system antitoxin SocA domain-containing protein [Varibaculum prostatecancerukia]